MNVLVVDDDVVARMMLMHLVDSCGSHAIVEADDGADAWRQLEAGLRPDIVFCDLRMPHLSGLELLQRVRHDPLLAALPFVLVSAASDSATMDEAAQAGASGYIVKPFRHDDVRIQFERLFPPADANDANDEAPDAVVRRLGIDVERLRLYLDGLARQLQAAQAGVAEGAEGAEQLARLRAGCSMLGLHGAAAALERAPLAAGLAQAQAAVMRQIERAARA
ncbi:two-component system chemotaxis response regulator CheY [Massilia aurea]|uniref:Two-component system chemotaxis response regulator CheY n=1 Tax=Massilia aurea TaxID=373040 RepID=A0A7W9U5Z4_9BURK|nr:response regulator [Massilia aurea]MBB6132251.1 two-component system chemotaxis response regulator CheY [Massilia aurea]